MIASTSALPRFQRTLLWCLIAIVFFAPWPLGSNRIWAWSLLHTLIALVAIGHVLVSAWFRQPWWHHKYQALIVAGPLLVATVLCLQLLAVAGFSTADPFQSTMMLQRSLYLALFLYLLSQYCRNHDDLKLLLIGIVLTGTLQAAYGSSIYLAGMHGSWFFNLSELDRARGSFVYQNHFANYIALCLALAIGWMLSELSRQQRTLSFRQWLRELSTALLSQKVLLRLAVVVMILALVMSRSRMGNAGFFAALAIVSLLALWLYRNPPRWLKPVVLSIFVLDMIIIGSMFGVDKVKERLQETSFASETRDEVVLHSIPLLQEHWLTGTGGGSFYTVFPSWQQYSFAGFYDHAHNDYLQFAIELGVPVTMLLGLWLLMALWLALRSMQQRQTRLYQGVGFGAAMAIVHMLFHSSVDFSLQAPANTLLFCTILAMAVMARYLPAKRRQS